MPQLVQLGWLVVAAGVPAFVLAHYPSVALAMFTFGFVLRGGRELPGGINPTAVLLVVAVLGVLLYVQSGRKLSFRPSRYDLWVGLLAAVFILGGLAAPDIRPGLSKAVRLVVVVAVPYFVARVVIVNPAQLRKFTSTVIILSVAVAGTMVVGLRFPFLVPEVALQGIHPGQRLSFIDANPIMLGTFFMVGALLLVSRLHGKRGVASLLGYGVVAMLVYATLLSGTRGAIAGILVALALYLVGVFVHKPRQATLVAIAVAMIALLMPASAYDSLPNWSRFKSLATPEQDHTIQTRRESQSAALSSFVSNPVLGSEAERSSEAYPHNIFLESAAAYGVLGLLPLVMLLGLVIGRARRYLTRLAEPTPHEVSLILAALLPLIGVLVHKQFSYGLESQKDLFVFLGIAVNLPRILSAGTTEETNEKTVEHAPLDGSVRWASTQHRA